LLDALHRAGAGAGSSDGNAYAKKQIEEDEAMPSEENEAKQSEEDEDKQSEEDEANQSEENETEKILQELLPHIAALQDIIENAKNHQHAESAAVEKLKEEIVEDVTRAKQHGVKLEDLLQSINRQDRKH
jgi:type VI protein secretion system component VasF